MNKRKTTKPVNSKITSLQYSTEISIDTLTLVAKLTYEQQEELANRIILYHNNQYQDQYFRYSRVINNIIIKVSPRNPLTAINYNTMIIFPKNASLSKVAYSIREILQFDTWKIKRIDIAFDFSNNTPFSSFSNRLIMKHHGNVKFLQQSKNDKDWKSEYVGSLNPKTEAKACCYDRNEKESDMGTGIVHDHPLRFEVRLYPKLNEYNTLTRIDHGWIEKKLEKFIFVPDIELLPINKWDKRRLYKIQEDYDYLKQLPSPKQKKLKRVAKEHRVAFEDIYSINKEQLFSFLKLEPLSNESYGVSVQLDCNSLLQE